MKKVIKIAQIIFSVFYISTTFAGTVSMDKEQKFEVGNNDTIISIASRNEITRIVFEKGNVDTVHAIGGELQYTAVEKDLYIKVNVEKPINFFVKTSLGQTYKFILDVRDIPATQILVRSKNESKHISKQKKVIVLEERLSLYDQKRISQIIDLSLKPKPYVGFEYKQAYKKLGKFKDLLIEQIGTITGKHLKAKKLIITNISNTSLSLNSKDFVEEGIMALYLDKEYLGIGESAVLIKIREQHG